jgi:hypothetical protein
MGVLLLWDDRFLGDRFFSMTERRVSSRISEFAHRLLMKRTLCRRSGKRNRLARTIGGFGKKCDTNATFVHLAVAKRRSAVGITGRLHGDAFSQNHHRTFKIAPTRASRMKKIGAGRRPGKNHRNMGQCL